MTANLQPGPELDRLVAHKVLGWGPVNYSPEYADGRGRGTDVFHPSRDMRHALEILMALPTRQDDFALHMHLPNMWTAGYLTDHGWECDAEADTAPLAICLAALAAIEDQPGGEGVGRG